MKRLLIPVIGMLLLGGLTFGCSSGDAPVQTTDAKGTEEVQTGTKAEGAGQVRAEKGMRQTTNPPGTGRGFSGSSVGDASTTTPGANAPQ